MGHRLHRVPQGSGELGWSKSSLKHHTHTHTEHRSSFSSSFSSTVSSVGRKTIQVNLFRWARHCDIIYEGNQSNPKQQTLCNNNIHFFSVDRSSSLLTDSELVPSVGCVFIIHQHLFFVISTCQPVEFHRDRRFIFSFSTQSLFFRRLQVRLIGN